MLLRIADKLVSALRISSTSLSRRTVMTSAALKMENRTLTPENMNSNLIRMEYAVRGPLVIRAAAIEKELEQVLLFLKWHDMCSKAD